MKLEFLDDINEHHDDLIRLFDFDISEAKLFRSSLERFVGENLSELNLTDLEFIKSVNCNLSLLRTDSDKGIKRISDNNFVCELSKESYLHMIDLLEPFCTKDTNGYQWLHDVICPIEFLFSPTGDW